MAVHTDATGPPAQQPVTMWHNPAARLTGGSAGGMPGLPMPGLAMFSGMMSAGTVAYSRHETQSEVEQVFAHDRAVHL